MSTSTVNPYPSWVSMVREFGMEPVRLFDSRSRKLWQTTTRTVSEHGTNAHTRTQRYQKTYDRLLIRPRADGIVPVREFCDSSRILHRHA